MRSFLINLFILIGLAAVLYLILPDMMRQIFGIYNGLGILPVFILLVTLAALPKRRRRKRRNCMCICSAAVQFLEISKRLVEVRGNYHLTGVIARLACQRSVVGEDTESRGLFHGLAAAVDAQLLVNVQGMPFHGERRQEQLFGDLLVAEPLGQPGQDLQLAIGERRRQGLVDRCWRGDLRSLSSFGR